MNLRHLRTFVSIADAGGFARAANRLNLSQPALSRQIRALETELGVPLFDRIGRRVQLTSEGEDLLRRSRRLLAEADSLAERARALKGGQTGLLRAACVFKTDCSIPCTCSRRCRPLTGWAAAPCWKSPSWPMSHCYCCAETLDRASGSMPLAASRISGRACCWKALPRTRSSRWPQPVTESRSFPPTRKCRGALFVPCRWLTAGHRSEGGR